MKLKKIRQESIMKSTNFKTVNIQKLDSYNGGYIGGVIRLGGKLFSRFGSRLMSTGGGKYLDGKYDLMLKTADEAWDIFVGIVTKN